MLSNVTLELSFFGASAYVEVYAEILIYRWKLMSGNGNYENAYRIVIILALAYDAD